MELLLFEWKPRSVIPELASAVAAVVRRYILGFGPLFPVPEHPLFIGPKALVGCALLGLLAGALSALLTLSGLSPRKKSPSWPKTITAPGSPCETT